MANLINGNGYADVTAQRDADYYGGLTGGVTGILPIGQMMSAAIVSNVPRIYDGVIVTKEGRRIQIDYGAHDDFTIPTGTEGTTAYYIIGYKLSTESDDTQICEMFVQAVNTSSSRITENMLKDGNAEIYVSLYLVTQTGTVNSLGSCLLPTFSRVYSGMASYNSPSQLSLSSPTIAALYAAMPENSVAYIRSEDMASASLPVSGAYGVYVVTKRTAARGAIQFLSKYSTGKDYRMHLTTGNVPTGAWIAELTLEDVSYVSGTQYSFAWHGGGYLTNGKKSITFAVPLNRIADNVSRVTHVRSSLQVRQNGGYIVGSGSAGASITAFDSYSISLKDNCLVVTVTQNAGIGGTNNEPVAVSLESLVVTFS